MEIVKGFESGASILRARREGLNEQPMITSTVRDILSNVQRNGDRALQQYTSTFDGVELTEWEVSNNIRQEAFNQLTPELKYSLETVAGRVIKFHEASMPKPWMDPEEGYGELHLPIDRVGIYIPGGGAAYPSSVLMTAIPARVAGVSEIVVLTPPGKNGHPNDSVLAACEVAGVDKVFQVGGAQAIAAMAYGTETIPKVDLICGPGNIYVTTAKRMVFGIVGIDGLYGPTETVLVADSDARPEACAADLIAQAEHDPLASPIFVSTSEMLINNVQIQIDQQLSHLTQSETARRSLAGQGVAILVDSIEEGIQLANLFAPEHLCLLVSEPARYLPYVRHAGGVFLGELSPEVMGDYVAGPSHVMPTGGTAKFSSPLGVHQFLKTTAVVSLSEKTFDSVVKAAIDLATAEGLLGHAKAMEIRKNRV